MVDLPPLELVCFGAPTARLDGRRPPPDVLWRKHLALLAYLALSPDRTRSRDHLLGLLWPEKEEDKARHSLNEALRRLRLSLGNERLVSQGEAVRLSGERLEVDAVAFERRAASQPRAATQLLRGDFLEGLTLDDAPAFEEWVLGRRAHFRGLAVALFVAEAREALAAGRPVEAERIARRALAEDPLSGAALELLMRAVALTGEPARALAAYRDFVNHMQRELGEAPHHDLVALAERVRSGEWRQASQRYAELEPPLVGRAAAHRAAFELLDRPDAQCLVVVGDPGMGKTRLLNECVERLALSGAVMATARPLESDSDATWSTLRHLVRSGLASAPGAAGTEPRAFALLAALVPELAARVSPAPPRDTGEVAGALASLLGAIADERRVGLALDNAQFADGPSIGALGAAVAQLPDARVTLLVGVDAAGAEEPRELLTLLGDVGRAIPGQAVRLDPLTLEELRELVVVLAPWCTESADLDRLTRRLMHETGGSPLLAVILLRGLDRTSTLKDDLLAWPQPQSTYESPLPFSVPHLARIAIVARLADVDEESRSVLGAASVGGAALDLELVAALAELPVSRVEAVLDLLERRRFVTYDGRRYVFPGALVAQIVRAEYLTAGQRQRFRRRAIEALAGRTDLESRVLRAELMAKVDAGRAAFEEALAAARDAQDNGAGRMARRALAAAERAARGQAGWLTRVAELRKTLTVS